MVDTRNPKHFGYVLVHAKDETEISILGPTAFRNGVAITRSQFFGLRECYGGAEEAEDNTLSKQFRVRHILRQAEKDGLRVMAYMAEHGLLESGMDPVLSLELALLEDDEDGVK